MDGLRVSAGSAFPQGMVQNSTQGIGSSQGSSSKVGLPAQALTTDGVEKTFSQTLNEAVNSVNEIQKQSDTMIQKLATGETTNIHDVMVTAEKADIALKLMVSVRNKMIEAYQEIMKMQV